MDPQQALGELGLTPAEARLYLLLLQNPESTASDLAKLSDSNRTFIYDRLKKLLRLGLATHVVKDDTKYFSAAPPSQLLSLLHEKETALKDVLPALERLRAPPTTGPQLEVYSSIKGLRSVLNLVLKAKGPVHVYGSLHAFKKTMGPFYELWNKQRLAAAITLHILTKEELALERAHIEPLSEDIEPQTTTFTFDDQVIVVFWADHPVALWIKNKHIADEQRALYMTIASREVRIYSGVDGIVRAFYELIEDKNSEYCGFGYSESLAKVYGKKISNSWHESRLANNVGARLISFDDASSREYFSVRRSHFRRFDVRFLNRDLCGPACVSFSRNLIAIFIYTEPSVKVIVSKNKETIAVYRRHFEKLWKMAKH